MPSYVYKFVQESKKKTSNKELKYTKEEIEEYKKKIMKEVITHHC